MKKIIKKLIDNIENNEITQKYLNKKRKRYLSRKFIMSKEYNSKILKFYSKKDGNNSAELKTLNFKLRHHIENKTLGSWRWLGTFENKELISNYVFSKKLKGIDLGGARGPISLNVDICDHLDKDIFGRKVKYNSISSIENNSIDFIWSSHTLEHIPNLEDELKELSKKVKKGGKIILNLPAYSCKRWRSGLHKYEDIKGDSSHLYTFYLSNDKEIDTKEKEYYLAIDKLIKKYFVIEIAKYVGDNSIFIYGEK